MRVILSVADLSKSFGALRVTDQVSFDVFEGEILGIIGPNGAGKTTLFGLLAGSLPPDRGKIDFRGLEITRMPAHERVRAGLARTYQVPKPFGHMTVYDNIKVAALFGGHMGEEEASFWVDRVLAMTGLQRVSAMLAGRLPLLLRKRHELARALAVRPRLLLVDEVAAGLTDREVDEFIDLIGQIRGMGITVVWIEHVMKTMLTSTDRLLALAQGALIAAGTPDEVINAPEVRRVYLGA
jgi:branched-chain amino acid transport system ATP-binding protein